MTRAALADPPPVAPAAPPAPRGLAELYAPGIPARDEMTEPDGSLRPHWRQFVSMLDDLGREEVRARADQVRRLIRENGITHNIYDDPDGQARPWNLDLLPLMLPAADWQPVNEGLVQRARLFDALLADLYGPSTAFAAGLLPAELVHANPAFLRPCHGISPPGGRWLHLYSADLARGADGRFVVLNDRTQAPSGAGYSLENRIVLTRVLPTVFAQSHVLRLAPFFIALRATLAGLAANRENPRVVVFTPGPYNETYFEHAYLARYLGYALVQGKDLTVRDGRVYLKTLSGLQRVDVILRRVDDAYCDPLELYPHSFLGVPGLLQAVREGNVAVANALGSGVLQAPGFLPFLPALCRHLLGEELMLPSVPSWWCGDPASLEHVLANLATLVLKPALPTVEADPVFGHELSRAERDALAAKIRAHPGRFLAQEAVPSFMTPVYANGDVQSRRFVLRAYLAASDDAYVAMPGGMTRVTATTESLRVSMQKGGGSKDTWVLGEGPVAPVSLIAPATAPLNLSRGGGDLPSRIADDLFWLGRYVQRGDSIARLGRCVFGRLADLNAGESPRAMRLLMTDLVGRGAPQPGPTAATELAAEMFSARDPAGLRAAAGRFCALARVLRDRISGDAWRTLQAIQRDAAEFDGQVDADRVDTVLQLLNRLISGFLAFGGVAAESLMRGQSWRFLDMGVRIERGIAAASLLRATLTDDGTDDPFLLDAILEVADSSLTYRRRYLNRLEFPAVIDLLVADETNPRAVAFQARALEDHLGCLPRDSAHPHRSPDLQAAIRLRTNLRLADLATLCRPGPGRRTRMAALSNETIDLLCTISEQVGRTFFSHVGVSPRPLTPDQEAPL